MSTSVAAALQSREEEALERIRGALRGLQFGEVRLVIQDGVLVQLERVEKQRFDRPAVRR